MLVAVYEKNYCVVYYNFWHTFVACLALRGLTVAAAAG